MDAAIDEQKIKRLLDGLLGCEVAVEEVSHVRPHSATARGLVTNENQLVAVIAADLPFAHHSGAALSMVPAADEHGAAGEPDADLIAFYDEVANVVSRLVNESVRPRLRLDPGLDHAVEDLEAIVAKGHVSATVTVDIEGHGAGHLGMWSVPDLA